MWMDGWMDGWMFPGSGLPHACYNWFATSDVGPLQNKLLGKVQSSNEIIVQ
jgi:hypothetical protein